MPEVIEAPVSNPPTAQPTAAMQIVVVLLSNGQVSVTGPLEKKSDCIFVLAAGIQAVLAHKENKILQMPAGALPPVKPFKY